MIIFHLSVILIFILFYIGTKSYKQNFGVLVDPKVEKLFFLYPMSLFIIDKVRRNKGVNKKITKQIVYQCRKLSMACFILFLTQIFSITIQVKEKVSTSFVNESQILRPKYGQGTKQIPVEVLIKDNNILHKENITLTIKEQQYSWEVWEEELEKSKNYIDAYILKNNLSMDCIQTPLFLMKQIPNSSIKIEWDLGISDFVDRDGNINNKDLKEAKLITIYAKIRYKEWEAEYPINLIIQPKILTEHEIIQEELEMALNQAHEKTKTEEIYVLPITLGNKKVVYREESRNLFLICLLFSVFATIMAYKSVDQRMLQDKKKRNKQMLLDYPEVISKITLLLSAGLTMKGAWGKIVQEYNQKQKTSGNMRYIYEEMRTTLHELENGIVEGKAYTNFGTRIQLLPYLKLGAVLSQNVRKGSKGLIDLLELEVIEALEERKELAKRLGEEAGTKLLLPMGILLILVLVIIMIPAFLTFMS